MSKDVIVIKFCENWGPKCMKLLNCPTTVAHECEQAITKNSFVNKHLPSLNKSPAMCLPSLKRPKFSLRRPLTVMNSSLKRAPCGN